MIIYTLDPRSYTCSDTNSDLGLGVLGSNVWNLGSQVLYQSHLRDVVR